MISINGESVLNKPLSEAIKLLQQSGQRVQLQMCRKVTGKGFFLPLRIIVIYWSAYPKTIILKNRYQIKTFINRLYYGYTSGTSKSENVLTIHL